MFFLLCFLNQTCIKHESILEICCTVNQNRSQVKLRALSTLSCPKDSSNLLINYILYLGNNLLSNYFLSVVVFQIMVKLLFAFPTKASPVQSKLIPRKGTVHPPFPLKLQKAHLHNRLPCPPPSAILAKKKMIHLHLSTALPSAYWPKSPRKLLWGIFLNGFLSFTVGFGSLLIASLEGLLRSKLLQRKGMFTQKPCSQQAISELFRTSLSKRS